MTYAFEKSKTVGQAGQSAITSVVSDIDRTIEFYSKAFGIGPFHIHEVDSHHATWHGRKARPDFALRPRRLAPARWCRSRS